MRERPIIFSGPMVCAILDGRKTQTRRIMKPQPTPFVQHTADRNPQARIEPYIDSYCSNRRTPENPRGMSDRWCWWTRDNRQGDGWWRCPYGQPGDRLWVRETWNTGFTYGGDYPIVCYRASNDGYVGNSDYPVIDVISGKYGNPSSGPSASLRSNTKWKSSTRMPRWASRILLEVTDVRVERLQTINEEDAIAEGLKCLSKDGGQTWKFGIPDRDGMPGNDDDGWKWIKWSVNPITTYRALWESIHGPGSWDINPWVWAVTLRRIEQEARAA